MSADNAILVASFPSVDGTEYRVAMVQGDSVWDFPEDWTPEQVKEQIYLDLKDAPVFGTEDQAYEYVDKMQDKIELSGGYVEYGTTFKEFDFCFPTQRHVI